MKITKKQIKEISEIIYKVGWSEINKYGQTKRTITFAKATLRNVSLALADYFNEQNKTFDKEKFIKDCEVIK